MKVLHLNYGRVSQDAEPDGDSIQYFEIETFRLVHGTLYITPKGGKISKDEISLTMVGGMCYYDERFYSDVWVETLEEIEGSKKYITEYDAEKSMLDKDVEKKHHLSSLIYQLDTFNTDGWDEGSMDGETMQHVIEKLGMDEQMLRQLIMTLPTKQSEELLAEKKDLDEAKKKRALESLTKEQLVKRLSFIEGDAKELRELLVKSGTDMQFTDDNAPINTILANIEIASNIEDSEPEDQDWKK